MKKILKLPQKYQIGTKSLIFDKFKYLFEATNSKSSLETFTESNDSLIMELYTDKVIKCPIKIGTLDFNKITKEIPKTNKFKIT